MPVKINRTRSIAKKAMRRSGKKGYRPEQILVYDILKIYAIGIEDLEMEKKPPNIVPLKGTDLTGDRSPILDIYFKFDDVHVAVRVNGQYHDEQKQDRKDIVQRLFLENQPERWQVFDFVHWKMSNLFKRNQRKLLPGELMLAFNEVKRQFIMTKIKFNTPINENWEKLVASHCN